MTWPGWSDVLPLLTLLAALIGGLAALARLARPWMQEAAREAAESLYARLKENDFKHLEDRIGEGLRGVNERLDRAREDRAAMERRLLAAMRQPGPPPPEDSAPPGDRQSHSAG